jgi:hypothetical protein
MRRNYQPLFFLPTVNYMILVDTPFGGFFVALSRFCRVLCPLVASRDYLRSSYNKEPPSGRTSANSAF